MEHTHRKPRQCKFSIIVPVLNEQGQIHSFIDKINDRDFDGYYEIIIENKKHSV